VTDAASCSSSRGGNDKWRVCALVAFASAALLVAGSAHATPPGFNGPIAFTAGNLNYGVGVENGEPWYSFAPPFDPPWAIAASGDPCGLTTGPFFGIQLRKDSFVDVCLPLTNPGRDRPYYDVSPAWSPDGSELAFVRIPEGGVTGRLYTIRAGSIEQETTCTTVGAAIDWSSQGEIFYTCSDPGHSGAFLWPSGRASCGKPGASFSPDGTRAAYPDGVARIAPAVAPLDPTTGAPACPDPVVPHPFLAANAVAWSPDQRKLAVGNADGVWVMNTNGTDVQRYWPTWNGGVTYVQWRPEGCCASPRIAPTYGLPGSEVDLWGMGFFAAGDTVDVTLRSCFGATCPVVASLDPVQTIIRGWYSVTRTIPPGLPSGQYWLTRGGQTDQGLDAESFFVLGSLSVDPPYGANGARLTASGNGFAAGETVQFLECSATGCGSGRIGLGKTTVDPSGRFNHVVTLVAGTASTKAILAAYGLTSGGFAFTEVTVLPTILPLTLSAPSGGSTVFVSGYGFGTLDQVDFLLFSCTPTCVYQPPSLGRTYVPWRQNSFAVQLKITQPVGAYYIVAYGSGYLDPDSHNIAIAPYTKTSDAFAVLGQRAITSVAPQIVEALSPRPAKLDPLQLRRQARAFVRSS